MKVSTLHRHTVTTLSLGSEEKRDSGDAPKPVEDGFGPARIALAQMDCDLLIHAGGISFGQENHYVQMFEQQAQRSDHVILWLTSPGGDPDTAYQISRLLQKRYSKVSVFINGWCKSSGTLICLGANELIMDDLGQLGPLDIQILNREEFGERLSGLNPIEALKSISSQSLELLKQQFLNVRFGGGLSTKQALEVATNLTGQLMSPITAQLDIMKYGEFTRSMRIAVEYGQRLAKSCRGNNLKPDAINLLTTGYPSHGFVIDYEEARESLFNDVNEPSQNLKVIAKNLQPYVDTWARGANNSAMIIDARHALGVPFVVDASSDESAQEEAVNAETPSASKRKGKSAKDRANGSKQPEANSDDTESNEHAANEERP
ncbi:hypothetical protein IPC1369_06340 [Pseudomonas aeruginosa]|uniref:SDH family Clp fold serine proteinase n=1 Tax=Pseudomonas aeruginosa TaxID=287 RepID=UPI000F53391C|nr:hypothetical protein [Pseudomonas aeruginosa]MBH8784485.1 hypothetical protein [Pseudomonas aeruginosa]MDY1511928.1 hypothetical protein [Pseudomonas aeruginosa]RUD41238.1 hypothetical protein IPC1369_06340 [Pseudomonas aeruginosa]RUD67995.1 hypothetical protein IPC1367_07910 [Pseudomonas aeruginosa]RUE09786.1 hypothetical protein IPC1356_03485 [Pseudomonas aeruginosa]